MNQTSSIFVQFCPDFRRHELDMAPTDIGETFPASLPEFYKRGGRNYDCQRSANCQRSSSSIGQAAKAGLKWNRSTHAFINAL